MYKLKRHVRFSINPFLDRDLTASNNYASNPPGNGLALFFDIEFLVTGPKNPKTGFVLNVLDIDQLVRASFVPVIAAAVRHKFREAKHISLSGLARLLLTASHSLQKNLRQIQLEQISAKLNPFRRLTVKTTEPKNIYLSEKFEFAATHKLWNDDLSKKKNLELFGKCANPTGHGHNYVAEVTIKLPQRRKDFQIGLFEKTVNENLIDLVDHKNLNADVPTFDKTNPTVENLTAFAFKKLKGKFKNAKLHCTTIWETEKTSCTFYG